MLVLESVRGYTARQPSLSLGASLRPGPLALTLPFIKFYTVPPESVKPLRRWSNRAERWMAENMPHDTELRALRDEAAALLGRHNRPTPNSKEVPPPKR